MRERVLNAESVEHFCARRPAQRLHESRAHLAFVALGEARCWKLAVGELDITKYVNLQRVQGVLEERRVPEYAQVCATERDIRSPIARAHARARDNVHEGSSSCGITKPPNSTEGTRQGVIMACAPS